MTVTFIKILILEAFYPTFHSLNQFELFPFCKELFICNNYWTMMCSVSLCVRKPGSPGRLLLEVARRGDEHLPRAHPQPLSACPLSFSLLLRSIGRECVCETNDILYAAATCLFFFFCIFSFNRSKTGNKDIYENTVKYLHSPPYEGLYQIVNLKESLQA